MDFKPQDLLFLVVLAPLLLKRDPRLFIIAGITCLVLAVPLFAQWVFFTAQRLTIYSFAFFLIACAILLTREFLSSYKIND